jgi:hypothetical protein
MGIKNKYVKCVGGTHNGMYLKVPLGCKKVTTPKYVGKGYAVQEVYIVIGGKAYLEVGE